MVSCILLWQKRPRGVAAKLLMSQQVCPNSKSNSDSREASSLCEYHQLHYLLAVMALRPYSGCCQCSSIRQTLYHPPRRRFATTSHHQAPDAAPSILSSLIPPESPKFIPIPRPLQPQAVYKPFVRGVLPSPRKIFRPNSADKVSPPYLASVTPEPLPHNLERKRDPKTREFVNYKARQADKRRENLRESLIELRFRKERSDRALIARGQRKQAFNRKLRDAPEREDERLTNPSVLEVDKPRASAGLPDPDRELRLAAKRDNVEIHKAGLEEERKDMLHRLYVNAGQFITTGAQLDEVIDRVFDDEMHFANDSSKGFNIWNLGQPETVAELLGQKGKGRYTRRAVDDAGGKRALTEERMRRLGEELTGGKM